MIREELVIPLRSIIGLRNIIAYQYGDVDFEIIHKIINDGLNDIKLFLEDIIVYCNL